MACSDSSTDASPLDAGHESDDASVPADARAAFKLTDALRAKLEECVVPDASFPESVSAAVALVNRLPAPTSIPCLVASLPRPLSIVASSSISSLQPADGSKSPRLFIMNDRLLLSVVATGEGASALELGEWTAPRRTLKGELHFPVAQPAAEDLPYRGLVAEGSTSTSCRFCHVDEQQHPTIAGGYVSGAMRPFRGFEVSLPRVRALRATCDEPAGAGPHCLMLVALFDFGEVEQGAFPTDVMEGF